MRYFICVVVCLELAVGVAILAGCGQTPYRVFAMPVAGPPPPEVPPVTASLGADSRRAPGARGVGPKDLEARHPQWDLNHAPAATLQQLPGIGAMTIAALIAGRPYRAKRELVRRKILTPEQYARWKAYLVVRRAARG